MKYPFSIAFILFVNVSFAEMNVDTLVLFKSGYVYRADSSELIKATVPGSIYGDLLNSKKIADPFFGDNEKGVKWVEQTEWIYVDTFLLTLNNLNAKSIQLLLEGIDTYAEVFLNGTKILSCNNMFVSYSVDIKQYCRDRNILKIHIKPINILTDSLASQIPYKLPGGNRVFARKAAMNFGWDFAPDLRAGGIWKPVKVICRNGPSLENVHFIQKQVNADRAKGQFEISLNSDENRKVKIEFVSETAQIEYVNLFDVIPGENKLLVDFEVENPLVWSTNGNGDQNLYDFQIKAICNGTLIGEEQLEIGFRDLKLIQEKDKIGESFYFKLNGKKIFCKGANVVPPEYFAGLATDSTWEALVDRAVDMNMNMLRIWGGGVYPPESFYTACDKKGILVWQDFMFACAMYPGDSTFMNSVSIEAEQAIVNYRNHPSLALWCGNNENIEGWYNWGWQKEFKYSSQDSTQIISDYKLLFEKLLSELVNKFNPSTTYWPSSPSIGWGRKESMLKGDSHYWGVWWGMEPFDKYKEKVPRFMSEYGFQSLPTFPSVSEFLSGGNYSFATPALKSHQKHPTGFETIQKYMDSYYLPSRDFRAKIYLSNILQAKGMHTAISAHRSAMPDCMGSLIWQLNDCWPGISWSLFDYYGREKAAYYQVKSDFEQVIVSSELNDRKLAVKVVSDSTNSFMADLTISLIDFEGNIRWTDRFGVNVLPGISKTVYDKDLKTLNRLFEENSSMVVVDLSYEGKSLHRNFHYFTSEKNLILKRPSVSMKRIDLPGNISRFEISVNYFAKNVELSINNETGGFTDNYFDMIPDTKYVIDHYSAEPLKPNEGLNIRSLIDTY